MLDETKDWEMVMYPFKKIYHFSDTLQKLLPTIDWKTARVYEMPIGISVNLFSYEGEWLLTSSRNSLVATSLRASLREKMKERLDRDMEESDWDFFIENLFWAVWHEDERYSLPKDPKKWYFFRYDMNERSVGKILTNKIDDS